MKQQIEVMVKVPNKAIVQEKMETVLAQIIINRIKEFPEEERIYMIRFKKN